MRHPDAEIEKLRAVAGYTAQSASLSCLWRHAARTEPLLPAVVPAAVRGGVDRRRRASWAGGSSGHGLPSLPAALAPPAPLAGPPNRLATCRATHALPLPALYTPCAARWRVHAGLTGVLWTRRQWIPPAGGRWRAVGGPRSESVCGWEERLEKGGIPSRLLANARFLLRA